MTIKISLGHLLQGVVKSIDRTRKVVYLSSDPDTVSKYVVCLPVLDLFNLLVTSPVSFSHAIYSAIEYFNVVLAHRPGSLRVFQLIFSFQA